MNVRHIKIAALASFLGIALAFIAPGVVRAQSAIIASATPTASGQWECVATGTNVEFSGPTLEVTILCSGGGGTWYLPGIPVPDDPGEYYISVLDFDETVPTGTVLHGVQGVKFTSSLWTVTNTATFP